MEEDEGGQQKAKEDVGSCGKEHDVLSKVLLSKHTAGSGAAGTAPSISPSGALAPRHRQNQHSWFTDQGTVELNCKTTMK